MIQSSRWSRAGAAAGFAAVLAVLLAPLPAAAVPRNARNGSIAFSAQEGSDRVLYTREANGGGLRRLNTGGPSDYASVSPLGRRIAFTRYTPSLGTQIWIAYLDGQGLRQLTTGPGDNMATWSPGGDRLIFARGGRGRRDLYTIPADGTRLTQLTRGRADDHSPDWSVKNRVAFTRRTRRGDDIYSISSFGGPARRLTGSRQADQFPAWSPSGRTLVFSRGRPGQRNLYLLRGDGSRARLLTRVLGDESQPAFSPDGKMVVFTYRRRGKQRLYVMRLKGKVVRRLHGKRISRVRRLTSSRSASRLPSWQPAGLDPVIAAAGDVACDPTSPQFNGGQGVTGLCRQLLTSNLLLRTDLWNILALGDLQYEDGTLAKFQQSFDPTWGRLKGLMNPIPGNHEYGDPGAAGYFDYFNGPGQQAGQAGDRTAGYYSFEIGTWHVISLNSECDNIGGCGPDSRQIRWLRADLAAHPAACTLVQWHRPTFTSGTNSDGGEMRPAWDVLYQANADVILNGHDHFYERFAPQSPAGALDSQRGIREFIAGMGGKSHTPFVTVAPNSEVRDGRTIGVLKLTLRDGAYGWRLVGVSPGGSADAGSGRCH